MRSIRPSSPACSRLMFGVAMAVSLGLPAWGVGGGPVLSITRVNIGAGGFSSGGDMELSVSVGQSAAGPMRGDDFELSVGFWFPVPPTDCEADGDVDLIDYAALSLCLSGPEAGSATPECSCYDVDHLGTVDLRDFAAAQNAFTGP